MNELLKQKDEVKTKSTLKGLKIEQIGRNFARKNPMTVNSLLLWGPCFATTVYVTS